MATSIAYTSREFATILADIRTNLQNATQSLPNVNDFLEIVPINFPIFNIADLAINIAVIFFLVEAMNRRSAQNGS